jgi:hypothetical protein
MHGRQGDAAEDSTVRTAIRLRSAPGWHYRELAENHLASINAPQATAEVLLSLVDCPWLILCLRLLDRVADSNGFTYQFFVVITAGIAPEVSRYS